ncbi:DUF4258 domain-containing protein [Candidatus Woesearchaeota archaeon]|nr:DUF4258 domain-containing protein [Candidatus Woesearchaeota archaeon]
MELILTNHARDKMHIEGIEKEQIKRCILRGAKFKQTDGFLAVYTYVQVAYKVIGKDKYLIKTVMVKK